MASELSKFIEDELRLKGINFDDEEAPHQALMGALRVEARVKEQQASKKLLSLKRIVCIGGGTLVVLLVWITLIVNADKANKEAALEGGQLPDAGASAAVGTSEGSAKVHAARAHQPASSHQPSAHAHSNATHSAHSHMNSSLPAAAVNGTQLALDDGHAALANGTESAAAGSSLAGNATSPVALVDDANSTAAIGPPTDAAESKNATAEVPAPSPVASNSSSGEALALSGGGVGSASNSSSNATSDGSTSRDKAGNSSSSSAMFNSTVARSNSSSADDGAGSSSATEDGSPLAAATTNTSNSSSSNAKLDLTSTKSVTETAPLAPGPAPSPGQSNSSSNSSASSTSTSAVDAGGRSVVVDELGDQLQVPTTGSAPAG